MFLPLPHYRIYVYSVVPEPGITLSAWMKIKRFWEICLRQPVPTCGVILPRAICDREFLDSRVNRPARLIAICKYFLPFLA